MANSTLFNQLILSFEDPEDLEQWAKDYGHFDEDIVQEHLGFLYSRISQENVNALDIPNGLETQVRNDKNVNSLFQNSTRLQ